MNRRALDVVFLLFASAGVAAQTTKEATPPAAERAAGGAAGDDAGRRYDGVTQTVEFALSHFGYLPLLEEGVRAGQFASTDPGGKGRDHGHFLRREGDRFVLAEMQGPGAITRIWSANAQGRLRVFLDGEAAPRLDLPFQELFRGTRAPFLAPLAVHASGGWVSYVPIPYAKSCRVELTELERPESLYYQVQYKSFPAGTPVRTFTPELSQEERAGLAAALRLWRAPGGLPAAAGARPEPPKSGEFKIPARGTHTHLDVQGPGTLYRLAVEVTPRLPELLRGVVVEAYYDGAETPSLSAPLADLFGCGFGPTVQRGLLLGWFADQGYLNFPMPFRERLVLRFRNTLAREVGVRVDTVLRAEPVPGTAGYLHAEFRAVDGVGTDLYEFARIEGPGKFVGITQTLQGVGDLWYLEGNEEITVDDEARPSIVGTGTEDFYNGGWYWNEGPLGLPLHGLGRKEEWSTNRTTPYRLFLLDAIPFARRFVGRIEHGSSNQVRDAYYASVAFWYGPRREVPPVDPKLCIVPRIWQHLRAGWTAGNALRWQGPEEVPLRAWEEITTNRRGLTRPLFQAFPVSYVRHDGPEVDARVACLPRAADPRTFTAALPVAHADRYVLEVRALVPPTADPVQVLLDGEPLGALDPRAMANDPWAPVRLPARAFAKGERTLGFVLPAGQGVIGIDQLRLVPAAPFVQSFLVGPAFPQGANDTVEAAGPDEARFTAPDFDPAAAGWKEARIDGEVLDLNAHFARPAPCAGYVAFAVRSPRARAATLRLGSDDGVRVWLDGRLVWTKVVHRPIGLDQDLVPVELRQGWNRFLVKVRNDDGGYGLAARIADPDGELEHAAAVPR
ncbi:MAG: DUF2961 domain-containing protein [Planctomycetes bacterium]|nr:DUF2961 domain-containing protein [Planctomycetota bacterium]